MPDFRKQFDNYESIGFRKRFHSPYEMESKYNGMPFKVVGRIPYDTEYADPKNLPMWRISFDNGDTIDAYPEEICRIDCVFVNGHS